jgi:hypothetical protein
MLVTATARVPSQVRPCVICGAQNGIRGGVLPVLSIIIPPDAV